MEAVRAGSPTLRAMIDAGEIDLVGAMYDVRTGEVQWLDSAPQAPAPTTAVAAR